MSDELFNIPESISPRLAWLRANNLVLIRRKYDWMCAFDDENFGVGDDQDAACVDLCLKMKIKHWNQE